MNGMRYREVIIIGAPRSGTNMLRDVICKLPGFGTWPCDEINYIWRHGNARWPSDELPAELATAGVRTHINRQFARCARRGPLNHVVEKTCANSLRVPFVDRVLSEAQYIFIYRDAIDAVASAIKRWKAPLDLVYTLKKARFVPLTDIPYYSLRFVKNRLYRLHSRERHLAFWGPMPDGLMTLPEQHSLFELCAMQWNACVKLAAEALKGMPPRKVHVVSYEDFVASPVRQLRAICSFLDVEPYYPLDQAVQAVSDSSVGKGMHDIAPSIRTRIAERVAPAWAALSELLE